jgi:hypothetical protein
MDTDKQLSVAYFPCTVLVVVPTTLALMPQERLGLE